MAAPAPPPVAPPRSYAEALAEGKTAVAAGDLGRAERAFEAAIQFDRKAAEPHIERARLFITAGKRAPAIAAARKAVVLAPGSSMAFNTLGRAELLRFGYDDAIAAFRKATELDADNVWAWNNLGLSYLQLENYPDAAKALIEATHRKGAEGYMWNNLGLAYEQLDQLDDARAAFERGGALGSREALASRKRLDGVKTIAFSRAREPAAVPAVPGVEIEAEAEPEPGIEAAGIEAEPEPGIEVEPGADAEPDENDDAEAAPEPGPSSTL